MNHKLFCLSQYRGPEAPDGYACDCHERTTDLTREELGALLGMAIAGITHPRDGWRRRDAGRALAAIRAWAMELSDWCYYVPERDGKRT